MEHSNQFLGTAPVGKLMKQYAVPCIISLLVGALYNIVDQIFIANASYLGSYGNAANTVVFPMTVVASVSYTHLDVYKRQVHGCLARVRIARHCDSHSHASSLVIFFLFSLAFANYYV